MSDFKKISPLRFWCQAVLPLSYDNSLSYMELLCKVIDYLNHVIVDINQIPNYINELISDDKLKEIMSELLDELREQIAQNNEKLNETASANRSAGDLIWLDGKLCQITRDILAGTRYIEDTDNPDVTGNFIYVSLEQLFMPNYSSENKRLTIHGVVDNGSVIVTRGDTHIYDGRRSAIIIEEV